MDGAKTLFVLVNYTNMADKKEKTVALLIDEKRAELLTTVMWTAVFSIECQLKLQNKNLQGIMADFLVEIADLIHENGWCKDPNCKYEQEKAKREKA